MSTQIKSANVRLKRAYAAASDEDGVRVLIDRLWPRGVSKVDAAIDHWLKEIAPSTELRQWFGHEPDLWPEFRRRYTREIRQHPDQLKQLRDLAQDGPLTLVYSARDELHNDAVVLRGLVLGRQVPARHGH